MATAAAAEKPPRPKGLRLLRIALQNRKSATMLGFGFSSGLPYALLIGTLNAWLGEVGVNLATIGVLSWIGLSYSFKFLWSPLVDRLPLPLLGRLGRRKSWILLCQTILVLGFAAFTAAVIAGLIPIFRRRLRTLYEAEGQRQAYLVETIHGMETVKALATEPLRRREWDARCAQSAESRFRVGRISTSAQSVILLLEKLLTVAVIGFGAQLVFDGVMTVGALVAFNMLSGRVTGPLGQIVSLVHSYQEAGLSVRMLGVVMNQPPERPANARGLRPNLSGKIEFERLTFRYSDTAPPALDDISLTIPAGSVFGIVGRSGSGKTTLTRLIRGMYPIQLGSVRIDGHDIREIDLPHLRSQAGVVLQQCFLFRGTVRENIAATKPDASLEEIVLAATMAGADEFIKQMPQGYDTLLEEGGTNLSGGQQQRLSIARALVRQPRILILDEATSSLDPESEAIVQANLAQIAEGRTLIIVSHRLSSLVSADSIVVLDHGRIVDYGRHGELLSRCMTYRHLWNQQHRHLAR